MTAHPLAEVLLARVAEGWDTPRTLVEDGEDPAQVATVLDELVEDGRLRRVDGRYQVRRKRARSPYTSPRPPRSAPLRDDVLALVRERPGLLAPELAALVGAASYPGVRHALEWGLRHGALVRTGTPRHYRYYPATGADDPVPEVARVPGEGVAGRTSPVSSGAQLDDQVDGAAEEQEGTHVTDAAAPAGDTRGERELAPTRAYQAELGRVLRVYLADHPGLTARELADATGHDRHQIANWAWSEARRGRVSLTGPRAERRIYLADEEESEPIRAVVDRWARGLSEVARSHLSAHDLDALVRALS